MSKQKVYIAGPMRGIPGYNYPAFMDAAKRLRIEGYQVFNPAEMDIEHDEEDYTSRSIADQVLHDTATAARRFATRDLGVLLSFQAEDGDFVATLPGWETSTGAVAEVAVAHWLKLAVWNVSYLVLLDEGRVLLADTAKN